MFSPLRRVCFDFAESFISCGKEPRCITRTLFNWLPNSTNSLCTSSHLQSLRSYANLQCDYLIRYNSNTAANRGGKQNEKSASSAQPVVTGTSGSTQKAKRAARKKQTPMKTEAAAGDSPVYEVVAYSTAEEYALERLQKALKLQGIYIPGFVSEDTPDVIVAEISKMASSDEKRQIFFFREGAVVFWNFTKDEQKSVLSFLKEFEQSSYNNEHVSEEYEMMPMIYREELTKSKIANGHIVLPKNTDSTLTMEKYTFSNVLALSVKLGMWESSLDRYCDSIQYVTEDLKHGGVIRISKSAVLKKTGELFELRHLINLSSDLLDTPDFYWEREELERLYQQIRSYFNIAKRTTVMNEKLNHCFELVELLSTHLSDKHHVRLEWMIITIIAMELFFEVLPLLRF